MKARVIALAAVGISFVSQFFAYTPDTRGAMLTRMTDERRYTGMETWGMGSMNGWEAHPYAWLVLAVLAIIYNTDFHEGAFWSRWGYWLTAVAIFGCTFPTQHYVSSLGGAGFMMGVAAIGVAIWAAIKNRREQKAPPPPPAA